MHVPSDNDDYTDDEGRFRHPDYCAPPESVFGIVHGTGIQRGPISAGLGRQGGKTEGGVTKAALRASCN
jgi:hypothetical protein